jgi:hypothetical protein
MYEFGDLKNYDGLGRVWGFSGAKFKEKLVNPEDYIPKKRKKLEPDEALAFVRREEAQKKSSRKKTEGGVYWTGSGPEFSRRELKGAKKAEKVPMPKKVFRPKVKIVRDLPKVKLPPVQKSPSSTPPLPKLPSLPEKLPAGSPAAKPPPEKTIKGFGEGSRESYVAWIVLGVIVLSALGYNLF